MGGFHGEDVDIPNEESIVWIANLHRDVIIAFAALYLLYLLHYLYLPRFIQEIRPLVEPYVVLSEQDDLILQQDSSLRLPLDEVLLSHHELQGQ